MPGGIHPPLDVKLSWPKPNYVDPVLRPNTIVLLACIMGPITVVMTLVRMWVRVFHQRCAGWDGKSRLYEMHVRHTLTSCLHTYRLADVRFTRKLLVVPRNGYADNDRSQLSR